MRVLLVDKDIESLYKLKADIIDHYVVDVANNGEEGSFLAQVNSYSAIVVEADLPDIDNSEFCKQTRAFDKKVPILMLMEEGSLENRLDSLNCGADAVLTKPVHVSELVAYLKILINRAYQVESGDSLELGDLKLNLDTKEVSRGKKQIHLRKKEFEILRYLLLNKNRVITKEQLLENVWDMGIEVNSNTLEVQVKSLRDKVDCNFPKKLIKTIYGFGYKIQA